MINHRTDNASLALETYIKPNPQLQVFIGAKRDVGERMASGTRDPRLWDQAAIPERVFGVM